MNRRREIRVTIAGLAKVTAAAAAGAWIESLYDYTPGARWLLLGVALVAVAGAIYLSDGGVSRNGTKAD